jgi:hypothetical protein
MRLWKILRVQGHGLRIRPAALAVSAFLMPFRRWSQSEMWGSRNRWAFNG